MVGPVSIPAGYDTLIRQMSQSTGLPQGVIIAQAEAESGFNASAVSPAGAEGWLQFLPSTYQGIAAQAGVSPTSEFDPASEAKAYDVYMGQLLQQYGGNIKTALEAYNAGPGDLAAGAGYASGILTAAGEPVTVTAGQGTSTTSALGGLGSILGGGLSISGILGSLLGDMTDVLERLGLILFGGVLIVLGIHILSGGGGGGTTTNVYEAATPSKGKHAKGSTLGKESAGLAKGTGATEAVEAAAVA